MGKENFYKGLLAAPATPTHENGDLNSDAIPQYVDHLVSQGVLGVYVNGTTGEGPSFTTAERKKIAEAWISAGKNKLKCIMIQVGGGSLRDSQELAKHAESLGANAVATFPPLFFKPTSVDDLINYCRDVAAAAPHTPFFYYHFPAITQVTVSIPEFLEKGSKVIPNLAGAKFTSIDMQELSTAIKVHDGHFNVLSGYDELLGPSLLAGGTSFIGGSYTFTGAIGNRLIRAFEKGNMNDFKKEQTLMSNVSRVIAKQKAGIAALITAIDLLTPFSVGPPRVPLRPLSASAREVMAKDFKELGFTVYRS